MPPPPGGGQQADNSLAPLWITLGIFIAAGFIWYFFKDDIIRFVVMIRGFEVELIRFFVPKEFAGPLLQAESTIRAVNEGQLASINVHDLINLSTQVGDYLRFPMAVILLGLAFVIYHSNAISRYKKTYSMLTLMQQEKANWPQIIPVSNLDLINTDINKGPWAMAMTPMEFAKQNGLLIVEETKPSEVLLKSKAVLTAKVNRDEARKVFAMQIGKPFQGIEKLPIHARALFACCAARIAGDREGPSKLLDQIANSTASGKLDFSGVDVLLNKHKDEKIVQRVCQRHAFILTIMASMLETARQDGVFASADFLWLKPVDRAMWFMLNSVGRQTPCTEVSGPFAHWLAEKELGRKLNVPMVEEAVNGLAKAVSEFIYVPDEE